MAKKGFLKTGDESFLPITRGELVVDSSGDPAFFSDDFVASSDHPGLMSTADKEKLDSIDTTRTQESLILKINSGSTENSDKYTFDGSASKQLNIEAGKNVVFTTTNNNLKIDVEVPTSLTWNQITNKPTKFNPSEHKHVSNDITIANYSIASAGNAAIQNNDTLTTALGKLEKTASTAYLWYQSITQEDTDDLINKWHEIVEFVNSITDSEEITDAFVTIDTDQEITGQKTFKPSNNTDAPFAVSNSVKVDNLNAALLDGHTADDFVKTDSAYWANLPIQTDEDLETEPVFGSVTANTYILSTAGPEITLSENSTKSGIVELTIDNTPEIVLDTRADLPTLRPANPITEGEDNTNMKLGDDDHKWSEVCASTFKVDSPIDSDSENLVRPLHINDEGVITRSDYTVGSDTQPIYMSAGCLVPLEESVGNATTGVYLLDGIIKPMRHSLNATVNSGTTGKLVKYTGANAVGPATTVGTNLKGIYLNGGVPTVMTHYLNADVNTGTKGTLVCYSESDSLSAFSDTGYIDTPVYINAGKVEPVSLGSSTSELYLVGVKTRAGDSTGKLTQFHVGNQGYQAGVRMVNGTTVYAKGGFYETSDERLKNFTGNVEIDFDSLSKIPKKYFTWVNSEAEARQIGTSAQELQKLYPELVEEDNSGTLHVAYDKLSIVALKAVDDLYNLVKDLKASQDDLIARLELLESRV
jgi:hypothetical protein